MTGNNSGEAVRPPRGANIRDVARAAGVSHQTVSRVINGHPSLREETRQRVVEAMEQLAFRPNRAARALVTSRSRILGVLVSNGLEYGPAASLQAIEAAAADAGYSIDIANLEGTDRDSIVAALDRLMDHAVEGLVILAPQSRSLKVIEDLSIRLPFVTVHSTGRFVDHRLSVDQLSGARLATRHLLELGHRSILHLAGPEGWVETAARLQGYREEMAAWQVPALEAPEGDWTAESGYRIGKKLMAGRSFSAVFSSNDQMALGMVHALAEAGLRVPQDVSVVGFDDIPEAAHYLPPLTTVRQDFPELGRRCVAALLGLLVGEPSLSPGDVVPELIIRGSTAPVAARTD
ncbi:LacI family DNA-binding transcriptional regulator [Arthrobacter crusticola]|uniref:LacI family DNA-binding transcriptional regulator n=1 Tax=Arthrobacter crusticola TaxID=2547960 RepID=A0A4R5TUM2_9MICC|nr:LacI family DNA-binding transcriptional regulator [Arthrobacter crusticola]TDK24764.1 LacI family DNA-binding transcriptional regulator [Arthrobacter crusticola]